MAHHTPKQVGWGPEVALLSLIALTALAQDDARGFDAHGFTLVAHDADIRDGLVLQRPGDLVQGTFFAGGVVEFAKAPLVLEDPATGEREAVLDNVLAANLSVGGAVHERLRFDLTLPLFLSSTGPTGGQGLGFGDMRLSAMGAALRPSDNGGWGLALVPWLDVPTGVDREFLGQRAVAGGFVVATTREWDRFTATTNLGTRFNPRIDQRNLSNADALVAGIGGVYSLSPQTGVGLELRGDVALAKPGVVGTGSPWEGVASVRHVRDSGGFLSGGVSTALSPGAGAATFRIFVGGGFGGSAQLGPRDRDLDGIVNREDACPDDPETANDYLDGDGCPDALPRLVATATAEGVAVPGAAVRVLVDGDFLYDDVASEPVTVDVRPGTVQIDATKGTCLAGSKTVEVSEDLSVDVPMVPVKDALLQITVHDPGGWAVAGSRVTLTPSEESCGADPVELDSTGAATIYVGPTTWSIEVEAEGYSSFSTGVMMVSGGDERVEVMLVPVQELEKVRVEAGGIVLLEQVHFDSGRATLRGGSEAVLDEVVLALKSTTARGSVEVQGHTDNVGTEQTNLALSQARADAVVRYLVEHGIPASRLVARGYGEAQPTTTNRTRDGRQANRRVEFVFVKAE